MLQRIAEKLGQEEALRCFHGAAKESGRAAELELERAFRLWPALDSPDQDGVPRAVLREAAAKGLDLAALAVPLATDATPRFGLEDAEAWLAHLEEHGYCVIAGVADAAARARSTALLWDFLEAQPGTRVRRGEPATWGEADWLPCPRTGLLGGRGAGQSDFCWSLRLLPGVRAAFAALWGTDDLLVSFDGANVFLPWSERPERRTDGCWWHVDQNAFLPGKAGRVCVQGLVTLTDATAASGGLCVIPGSHWEHRAVCARAGGAALRRDFLPVAAGDEALAGGGRLVTARAGDLVLWDSRCVHCNTPGDGGGRMDELLRVAGYVCMTPAAFAAPAVLEQRRRAFLEHVGTNHWPHEFLGATKPPLGLAPRSWDGVPAAQRRLVVGDAQPRRVRAWRAVRRVLGGLAGGLLQRFRGALDGLLRRALPRLRAAGGPTKSKAH